MSKYAQLEDSSLLFSWKCPIDFKSLCQKYSESNNNNFKFIIKYSDYKDIIKTPEDKIKYDIILTIKKDTRIATGIFSINLINLNKLNKNEENENHLDNKFLIQQGQIIYSNLLFVLISLDPKINFLDYNYFWSIPFFKDKIQYLNGQKERELRVKLSDLFVGENKINLIITNKTNNKKYEISYIYYKYFQPFGGNCNVLPQVGISLLTNFTFTVSDWKSDSNKLLYKIKYLNKNDIYFDLTNGGFSNNNFTTNVLPVSKNFILEIIDSKGLSTIVNCNANVNINKELNENKIEEYTKKINDDSQKYIIEEVFRTNFPQKKIDIPSSDKYINELNSTLNTISKFNFINNYNNYISILIEATTNNFKEDNSQIIFDIFKTMTNNMDLLLNDLFKVDKLYKTFDNVEIKLGEIQGNLNIILYIYIFLY